MDRVERLASRVPFVPKGQKIPLRAIFSYIFDYVIIVVLALIYAVLDKIITPFSQHFSLNNISLQYPYAFKERIPIFAALVISFVCPCVIIAVYTLAIDGLFSHHRKTTGTRSKYTFLDRLWELNCGILGLCLAHGAAFVLTGSLKNLVGKPRPDLISRCLPQAGAKDRAIFGLSTKLLCTQTDMSIMQDGFRSFPSGHSSSSFAGLFYLSLYLAAKLHVLDQRGEVWRTVIILIPTVAASCIAASRIMDARHHPFDVLFGSALGVLCGWASYRQYFPPLSHSWLKGRAYPMREWGVPVKHPDRTAQAMEDDTAYNSYGSASLEPMRAPAHYTGAGATASGGAGAGPMETEAGYEMGVTRAESSGNAFRDQISKSQRMRTEQRGPDHGDSDDGGDDIGYSRPLQQSGRV